MPSARMALRPCTGPGRSRIAAAPDPGGRDLVSALPAAGAGGMSAAGGATCAAVAALGALDAVLVSRAVAPKTRTRTASPGGRRARIGFGIVELIDGMEPALSQSG
ncbi:hypothetical protein KRMM14A1004_08720 [Krasilnikovia sp. MM14-A1004]